MTIIFAGMPFMFVSFLLRALLQGVGNGTTPLVVQLITIILNVILDPILIFGLGPIPAMEVAGGDTKPVMVLNITRLWGLRVPLAYFSVMTSMPTQSSEGGVDA
jgi:Na+-driven multidrug efflux pump